MVVMVPCIPLKRRLFASCWEHDSRPGDRDADGMAEVSGVAGVVSLFPYLGGQEVVTSEFVRTVPNHELKSVSINVDTIGFYVCFLSNFHS